MIRARRLAVVLTVWVLAGLVSVGAFKLPALFFGSGLGAATYRSIIPISIVATQVDEPTRAKYVHAMETVLRYYNREFGSILVPAVTLYLYESREAYEQGLVEVAGIAPNRAHLDAEIGTAMALPRPWWILINTTRARDVEGLVGHEFMHLMQGAWGDRGPDKRGPSWLSEGMGEWYRARIDESLGVSPRGWWDRIVATEVADRAGVLLTMPLTGAPDGWVRLNARFGRAYDRPSVLYLWAYLAYSRLLTKVSRDDVIRFFHVPHAGPNLNGAFEKVFRMSLGEFEADLNNYIRSLKK